MSRPTTRRGFFRHTAAGGAALGLAQWGLPWLGALPRVSADEAQLDPHVVRFHADIEPLVRLIEESPRERLLEEVAARIRAGTSYQEVLAALQLAGVRNVQPRPNVGFKFHAVLVVNSAHVASLASSEADRWLPIFWALDYFKQAQAEDERQGDWTMAPVDESAVPPAHRAREALVAAMDNWDVAAADAAVAGLARTAGSHELFELFCRYGARDFRDIGHKAIFVANSWRTLQAIGWQHAEPILRSLTYALLNHEGQNPATRDGDADRPGRQNAELATQFREDWLAGSPDPGATIDLLATLREATAADACARTVELVNGGVAVESLWDAVFQAAGELLVRQPGIVALHAMTSSNALYYAYQTSADDRTRRFLLLQNVAFVPLFREAIRARGGTTEGVALDQLEPAEWSASGSEAVQEILADVSSDRLLAARKTLAYLSAGGDPTALVDAARRLVFFKGTNSHDYKFSSAVLEDYLFRSPEAGQRYLAASMFNLRGSSDRESRLVARTLAALGA